MIAPAFTLALVSEDGGEADVPRYNGEDVRGPPPAEVDEPERGGGTTVDVSRCRSRGAKPADEVNGRPVAECNANRAS